jgi:hypothetical protein
MALLNSVFAILALWCFRMLRLGLHVLRVRLCGRGVWVCIGGGRFWGMDIVGECEEMSERRGGIWSFQGCMIRAFMRVYTWMVDR